MNIFGRLRPGTDYGKESIASAPSATFPQGSTTQADHAPVKPDNGEQRGFFCRIKMQ